MLSGSAKISIEEIGLSTSSPALSRGSSSPFHPIAPELFSFSPPFNSVAISDQFPDDISPGSKFALLRLGGSEIPEVARELHVSGSGQPRWERPRSTESSDGAGLFENSIFDSVDDSSSCGASYDRVGGATVDSDPS